MSEYTFNPAKSENFAIHHTTYTDTNIFLRFDWGERIAGTQNTVQENGFFVYRRDQLIGGIAMLDNRIRCPFLVPPFDDRVAFWMGVLAHARETRGEGKIELDEIPQTDADALFSLGAQVRWSQRRMCRPTQVLDIKTDDGIVLVSPAEEDLPEIASVAHQAHCAGYAAAVWGAPDIAVTQREIARRFEAFSQTSTWDMSVVAKCTDTHEIVGVCIAGIYPDSADNFSTIHQVSVLPQYQRRGIAAAMMGYSISAAHRVSPVITLGVLIGNPAEHLYRKLGFAPGPSYNNLIY